VLKLIASGVVVAGVLVSSTALAAEPDLVDTSDRHGDVKVEGSTDGIDAAVVNSIDLRHVTVTRQAHGVRVVVRMKKVLPPRGRWFQQIGVSVAPPGWLDPEWFFFGGATPQHLGSSFAYFVEIGDVAVDEDEPDPKDEDELFCRVSASKGAKVVSLTIPDRCLPEDSGQLVVTSILFDKRLLDDDDEFFAYDELRVKGMVDLQP
jgi:hypothetical protein